MSKQITLYRCSGYNEEICGGCLLGKPHERNDECLVGFCNLIVYKKEVQCIEYDNGLPCNIPDCPEHTGGDGESCNS